MIRSACRSEASAAIAALLPQAEAVAAGWRFRCGRRADAPAVRAEVEDRWLLLDALLENGWVPEGASWWERVALSGRLPGGVKFALPPGSARIHARAELPLGVGADLAPRLAEVIRGYRRAEALARGVSRADGLPPGGSAGPAPGESEGEAGDGIARLCREAGWDFAQRSPFHLAVELEAGDEFRQAQLRRLPGGGVAASFALEEAEPATDACREALAIFLLRASGWLRLARCAAEPPGVSGPPRCEVVLSTGPSPGELSEALSALSVAARMSAAEAVLLARDEPVARGYLACQPRLVSAPTPGATRVRGAASRDRAMQPGSASGHAGTKRPVEAGPSRLLAR